MWGFLNTNLEHDAWSKLDVISGAEGHARSISSFGRVRGAWLREPAAHEDEEREEEEGKKLDLDALCGRSP